MESQLRREMKKIRRNLDGIRRMDKLPGVMVVVDVNREMNGLREARKLGIPTICLIDTDGDPEVSDVAIPGNDDSMRSIDVIVRELCKAIADGKQMRVESGEGKDASATDDGPRRSKRAQFRADDAGQAQPESDAPAAAGEPAKAES
ncbi:MAG: 30S ribosomal protein S2 [Planctomycetota bacterium]